MLTVTTLSGLRERIRGWRQSGETIAFVPTMGNLHAGHDGLVETARQQADRVVISIFVNPSQFGPGEDFDGYPRTPDEDAERLQAGGVDLLYWPEVVAMYPEDPAAMSFVEVPGLSGDLCGISRPGHFRGVATVVLKLFNQVGPDIALFGEKDFQQLLIIRRMVKDLDLPVRILGVPTIREASGLALSSRNAYLSAAERSQAALLYAELLRVAEALSRGRCDAAALAAEHTAILVAAGFEVDYLAVRRQQDLQPPGPRDTQLVILVAARLGRARLIDNLKVSLASSP